MPWPPSKSSTPRNDPCVPHKPSLTTLLELDLSQLMQVLPKAPALAFSRNRYLLVVGGEARDLQRLEQQTKTCTEVHRRAHGTPSMTPALRS